MRRDFYKMMIFIYVEKVLRNFQLTLRNITIEVKEHRKSFIDKVNINIMIFMLIIK